MSMNVSRTYVSFEMFIPLNTLDSLNIRPRIQTPLSKKNPPFVPKRIEVSNKLFPQSVSFHNCLYLVGVPTMYNVTVAPLSITMGHS